jgi:hypothetical protein
MKAVGTLVLFALLLGAALAQDSDLAGSWEITWLAGGKPNTVTLTDNKGDVSGTYVSDDGAACSASGTDLNGKVSLHVECAKWDIWMNGRLVDGAVNGDYTAYGNSTGKFRMVRFRRLVTCYHSGPCACM